MGFFDLFSTYAEEVRGEEAPPEDNEPTSDDMVSFMPEPSLSITREQAMAIPSVSTCVGIIAGTIAAMPVRLYRTRADGAVEEVKNDYRCRMLNGETGDTMTGPDMKYAIAEDFLMSANGGHIYLDMYSRRNRIRSLRYIQSDSCACVMVGTDSVVFKEKAYQAGGMMIPPSRMVHVLRASKDGIKGESVVSQNAAALSVAYHTMLYERSMIGSGGFRPGFLQSTKRLGKKAMKALKEAWTRFVTSGGSRALVLNDGVVFKEASATSTEMQISELKKGNSLDISGIFHVPEQIIQAGSTEGAAKSARESYTRFCIIPICAQFEAAINEKMLLESEKPDHFFKFDLQELTKGNALERWQIHQIEKSSGCRPVDEIRREENLEPLGIDYVSLGLNDVLFNPTSGELVIPNMGKVANISDLSKNEQDPAQPEGGEEHGDSDSQ